MSCKNLSSLTTFSKTHRQTQRMHSWIGLGLRNPKKLVPRRTNSQILSCDHFSDDLPQKIFDHSSPRFSLQPNYSKIRDRLYDSFTSLFDKPSSARFPLRLYYSKSLERLYESIQDSKTIQRTFEKLDFSTFWGHQKTYPSRWIFLKRIDRHNRCIPGHVLT